jgi:AraC-like DNA-binding protein
VTLSATGAAVLAKASGLGAARLTAIKADIAQHLARPELTVGAVAARQGFTPRYVQLLFEREGTTFSEFVLGQRLLSAHRLLGDALYARWSITAIAFEVGFGDLSYFNRSFRRRYCASPSDVRKAALRGQPPLIEPTSSFLDNSEFAPVQDWRLRSG